MGGSGDRPVRSWTTIRPLVLTYLPSLGGGLGWAARPAASPSPGATAAFRGKAASPFWSPMKKEVGAGSMGALGERRPRVHASPSCGPLPGSGPRPPSEPLASLRLSGSRSSCPKRGPACSLPGSGGPGPLLLAASGPAGLSALSLGSCGSRRRWRTGRAPSSSPALRPAPSSAETRQLVRAASACRPSEHRDPALLWPRRHALTHPHDSAGTTYLTGLGLSSCQLGWPSGTPTSDPRGSPAPGHPKERKTVCLCQGGRAHGEGRGSPPYHPAPCRPTCQPPAPSAEAGGGSATPQTAKRAHRHRYPGTS